MRSTRQKISIWLLEGMRKYQFSVHRHDQSTWWRVMCLTGVDYFSTLSYAPGIAFLAAGVLSPFATVVLILLTLLGALPVYSRVASKSPRGQGSIAMLERLLPGWVGKVFVLCLLGFAATDFIITITLSAADAATHLIQNPLIQTFMPRLLNHPMALTMCMLGILGGIFLKGFREAIGIAVILVCLYLLLSLFVIGYGFFHLTHNWLPIKDWWHHLFVMHGSIWTMIGTSCLLFPRLALGLSGFETGVAVMPLVKGDPDDTEMNPKGRIRNTKKLLLCAALIMSVFLLASSIVTTILIPEREFAEGGQANGRAIAYLAHQYLGPYFGTAYDISTVLILWFAGASAMAGLLSLVPRYLPRFGMAPDWAQARRPLVIFYTLVSFAVTWIFNADVDAQGSAYATGVLVVMTSAAVACLLSTLKESIFKKIAYVFITLIFCYTTVANIVERPDGLKIASFFILVILVTSFTSRIMRSTELRINKVSLDAQANSFVDADIDGVLRLVAHRPGHIDYEQKAHEAVAVHNIAEDEIIFVDVTITDASDFGDEELDVICSLDRDGKLTKANPACSRVLGYSEDMLIGLNLRSILMAEDIESYNKALLNTIADEKEIEFESRVIQKSGAVVDVLWSIHWVESEKSFFCVGHDITARKEIERLKQKFMAMVSHDLRTPLTTISNYLEMLNAGLFGKLSDKGEHLLKVAERNVNRMLCLINDLLDLEKAEFGGLKLDNATHKLNDLLDQCIKTTTSLALRKQVQVQLIPTDLEIRVDSNRIAQVLLNLLSNAIKFSPKESTIKISSEKSDGMAIVHICDQGRGIPDNMKELIFDRFQQVEIADAVDQGGSGLGLAICKTLVELHGGKISAQNNVDKGSTFSFSVPLAQQEETQSVELQVHS